VIENIVATTSLETTIDFDLLTQYLDNSIYEPEQFPGIIYKPEKKGLTFLIFASGNVVIVGARNEEQIQTSLSNFRSKLNGYPCVSIKLLGKYL
jgi:transcription initiation factor TFIID TATA-box-binding protein